MKAAPELKWVNRFAPLYVDEKHSKKVCDLLQGTVLSVTGLVKDQYEEVSFTRNDRTVTGWMHEDDIEPYVRNFQTNIVDIENQTPDTNDLEQYMIHKSIKQTNMCGELCIASIIGLSLNEILSKWEQTTPGVFKRIFGDGKARGTSAEELKEILASFDRVSLQLSQAMYQHHISRARYTINSVKKLLARGSIIASVHINNSTGLIERTGSLHWISLTRIISERNGQGMLTFYNPAMNCIETASWAEFIASAGLPYGVFVPNVENVKEESSIAES